MLITGSGLVNDLGDAIARDQEVRQARTIAEAARTRLVSCVSRPEDGINLVEAQQMLDALSSAEALAGDAEDRVLMHHGLLTSDEAVKRAARRRPVAMRRGAAAARPDAARQPAAQRPGRRMSLAGAIAGALAVLVAGAAAVAFARRYGFRPPLARR